MDIKSGSESEKPLSSHYLAEFYDCNANTLNNRELLESIMTEAVTISGATIIRPFFHTFSPQGVSGVIVIAESHFSIHTWPEHNFASIDLFSCSGINIDATIEHIKQGIEAGSHSLALIKRGFINSPDRILKIETLS
ncbi:MAG: adenosylmethionine decarboxylase [Spirochaetes bacterium]|nr:adenosylmethionine decarboxylase [Spirochaetota bacterium]